MKAIDLFCGVGGATLGMLSAGIDIDIEVNLGVDHCPETASAYSEVTGVDALVADVGALRPDDLPPFDLVWASPPCQPYSQAGKRRGSLDERDALPELLRFIERFRPPVIVVEEVPLFRSSNGYAYLLGTLIKGGYHVESRVLNAANYGIPQARRRLFVVARLDGRPWRWPRATHCKHPGLFGAERWVSLDDAVGEQLRAREPLGRLPNWITSRWQQLPVALQDNVQVSSQLTTKRNGQRDWLHVRRISQPSFTITASMAKRHSHIVSGGQAWALTLEDAARLQGLPLYHLSSMTSTHIGNAVPPALARAVVSRLHLQ